MAQVLPFLRDGWPSQNIYLVGVLEPPENPYQPLRPVLTEKEAPKNNQMPL